MSDIAQIFASRSRVFELDGVTLHLLPLRFSDAIAGESEDEISHACSTVARIVVDSGGRPLFADGDEVYREMPIDIIRRIMEEAGQRSAGYGVISPLPEQPVD